MTSETLVFRHAAEHEELHASILNEGATMALVVECVIALIALIIIVLSFRERKDT